MKSQSSRRVFDLHRRLMAVSSFRRGILLPTQILLKQRNPPQDLFYIEECAKKCSSPKRIENLLVKSIGEQKETKQPLDLNDLVRQELQFFDVDLEFKHKVKTQKG